MEDLVSGDRAEVAVDPAVVAANGSWWSSSIKTKTDDSIAPSAPRRENRSRRVGPAHFAAVRVAVDDEEVPAVAAARSAEIKIRPSRVRESNRVT